MYLVIEIQSNGSHMATITNDYAERAEAEARYHTILAAAAVSKVAVHSAVMLMDTGELIHNYYYAHPQED